VDISTCCHKFSPDESSGATGSRHLCTEPSLEVLRIGRSVACSEDQEGPGGPVISEALIAEELGALDSDMSKVTKLQSAQHQRYKPRDSCTLRRQNKGSSEQWRTERGERVSRIQPNIYLIIDRTSENEPKVVISRDVAIAVSLRNRGV
jgi:hypothetical protein